MHKEAKRPFYASLEERIRSDHEASKSLETLLAQRRLDPVELWCYLIFFERAKSLGLGAWAERCNLDRRKTRSFARRLVQAAENLGNLFTEKYLGFAIKQRNYLWLRTVPRHMRFAAEFIEGSLRIGDDRGANSIEVGVRREFTQWVKETSGKPHDREVADLLRVVLGRTTIDAEEQRKFRTRHCRKPDTAEPKFV
jgi:hypothetical protein